MIQNLDSRKLTLIVIALILLFLGVLLLRRDQLQQTVTGPQETSSPATQTTTSVPTTSAKGVVAIESPKPKEEITSPLTVTGFVWGNNGRLTIKLKQKESGQYVIEDKVVAISGAADKISFAEAIQFGLPVMPQAGILEVIFEDLSGQGLDDSVAVEVNFPSDLGRGE